MPINSDFPKSHQVIGKHKHADGEHFHFVWGPGREDAETSTKEGSPRSIQRLQELCLIQANCGI